MDRFRQWFARAGRDTWKNWPSRAYSRNGLQQRLEAVKRHLATAIECAPAGRVRIVSICAGDGRDVLGSVASHARRAEVMAWLLEADRSSVSAGMAQAEQAGLRGAVHFLHADATDYASYCGVPRADVLLVCGVWGHVPPCDRQSLVQACRALAAANASVIWTRGVRRGSWRYDEICDHFEPRQWELAERTMTADSRWAVATHRLLSPMDESPRAGRIFEFATVSG